MDLIVVEAEPFGPGRSRHKELVRLRQALLMARKNYHQLVQYVPDDEIDPEITEKLDAIVAVAESANPAGDTE